MARMTLVVQPSGAPQVQHIPARHAPPDLSALFVRHGWQAVAVPEVPGDLGTSDLLIMLRAPQPDAGECERIATFVSRGGALLVGGSATAAWPVDSSWQALLPMMLAECLPLTEVRLHPVGEHDTTRRLDDSILMRDQLVPCAHLPGDAVPLLSCSWRNTRPTVSFLRSHGQGMVGYLGLCLVGEDELPAPVQQFIIRLARYLTGWREGRPVGMGLLGYGAIGFEHATAITATPGLHLRAICDSNPARLEEAHTQFTAARLVTDMAALLHDPTVDAVVVGTPPNTHAALALQLLRAGKHVIVEKPFCLTTAEADTLIATAAEQDRALTVYQNRRWDPDFLAIREALQRGTIGEVFHLEAFIGTFEHPCDYWHSHAPISGGVFYDWGSHYIDWLLQLMPGAVRDVRATAHKRVWQDVTNADQATLSIHFVDGAEATFIHSDVAALLKPKWYLLGTQGAIVGHWRHETVTSRAWNGSLIETVLAPAEALPEVTVAVRAREGQIHQQRLALPIAPRHPFHRNFADHLLAGEPLAVPPASSRRNIAVMEAAAASAARGSVVIPIDDAAHR